MTYLFFTIYLFVVLPVPHNCFYCILYIFIVFHILYIFNCILYMSTFLTEINIMY